MTIPNRTPGQSATRPQRPAKAPSHMTCPVNVSLSGGYPDGRTRRRAKTPPSLRRSEVYPLVFPPALPGPRIARASYPVDFALVTNGAHWVIDEIQLCAESTTTLRQLAAFARMFGTAEPFGLTCMSATVPEGLLETVDNPVPGDVVGILPEERTGELAVRLDAARTVRRLAAGREALTAATPVMDRLQAVNLAAGPRRAAGSVSGQAR